jgi:hypothetical protein
MPSRQTLDPEDRALYGDSLQPPSGYFFDAAVATTFSLDFETALAVPVSLALFAAENRDAILLNPLALLEGAERIAGRLVIFTDAAHIHAQSHAHSRLCALLEKIVVEVAAPRGGAFHPKLWALRFLPMRKEDPVRLRLLILSRNITRDRSWDISLCLDGEVSNRPHRNNKPLADLLGHLPDLAIESISGDARELVQNLAKDLSLAEWELPLQFDSVSFAINGFGGKSWRPKSCKRLGVISPFCDEEALGLIASLPYGEKPTLISRSEELAAISKETLDSFQDVAVLDDTAASEDGEEPSPEFLEGLHAKLFVSEDGWETILTVGSGNATRPALITGRNVELFATLVGPRSKVGSVADIMGPEGVGRLTRSFVAGEVAAVDSESRMAEIRLEEVRNTLCRAGLRLRCVQVEGAAAENLWRVQLITERPFALEHVGALTVWPITRGEDHARSALDALRQASPLDLGSMPLVDLTRFIACRLTDASNKASAIFSLGLTLEGEPPGRHTAILRSVINSKGAFFRYLRLLLSEIDDPFGAAVAAQEGAGGSAWRMAPDDVPLLEEMVKALCRGRGRLHAIERLMSRLGAQGDGGSDPVPDEFRSLWESFRAALAEEEARHAR